MKTTQPIRNKKQVRQFLSYYRKQGQYRNWVLVTLCIHTALRISDILMLRTDDVYDFKKQRIRTSFSIIEGKTKKSKTVKINKSVAVALMAYLSEMESGKALILSPRTGKAISRIQAHRLIRDAAVAVGIEGNVSCHSLRKTFGYHAWKEGVSPAVIMEIYNHSSLAVTRRYLGVTQSDMDEVYMRLVF